MVKTQLMVKNFLGWKIKKKLALKNSFCYTVFISGDMAELVDAADLKSADYYNLKGSSPFIPKATTHLDKSALEEKNKRR